MATYRRSPAATWRRLRTGAILAVPGSADTLQLNATGALVWDLLQEPMERSGLTSRLAAVFDRDDPELASDISGLLDELVACGAVVRQ